MRSKRRRLALAGVPVAGAALVAVLLVPSVLARPQRAPARSGPPTAGLGEDGGAAVPVIRQAAKFAVSKPLRSLPSAPAVVIGEDLESEGPEALEHPIEGTSAPDTVVQTAFGPGSAPPANVSFDGLAQRADQGFIPPDPNGEIGPSQYVQMVNLQMAVYDKKGRQLYGPVTLQTIFAPLGKQCGVSGVGDPVVVYDQLANRWVLTQFGFLFDASSGEPTGPYYECFAVSKTPDATGEYYLYAFEISKDKLNDYPKFGVWPDAYYMSVNQFADNGYGGVGAVAFDRARMLAGDPNAGMVYFDLFKLSADYFSMLPADLDGQRLPPTGMPEPFVLSESPEFGYPADQIQLFSFHVDWDDPAKSSFDVGPTLPVAPYNPVICLEGRQSCIPQKGSFQTLEALNFRLMFRAAYRNLGDHDALVLSETVNADGQGKAGVRWYELRNVQRQASVYQQGTFAPDANSRWMPSIAMDGNGNIAVGYSASGVDLFPAVRYSARLAPDPLGQLTLGEGSLVEGGGAQTHPAGRWGDYSDLTVDPTDDCTFWYTNEYLKATTPKEWSTRIGSFTIPGCDATAPTVVARNARGKAGKTVKLVYQTADNSGKTEELITIFRPNGKKLKTIATELHAAGTFSVTVKAPKPAGSYAWEVVASDAKENRSPASRAKFQVT